MSEATPNTAVSNKKTDIVKSPQPPRLNISLKNRKRLLLSQKQTQANHVDSNLVAGDAPRPIGFGSQESVSTASQSSLFSTVPVSHSQRLIPQSSLFSHIGLSRQNTKDASLLQRNLRQPSATGDSNIATNNPSIPADAVIIQSPPASFFGAVMSRSTVKLDVTVDAKLDKSEFQQALMQEETHNQSNSLKTHILSSPEKGDPRTFISSIMTPPSKKRKRIESSSETPKRSILKDLGSTTPLNTKSVNWDINQQQQLQKESMDQGFASPKPTLVMKSTSPFSKYSPGGHSLWTMLQSFKSNHVMDDHPVEPTKQVKELNLTLSDNKPTDIEDEDWIEVPISLSKCDDGEIQPLYPAQYTDWTLKKSMTLDCYPCLPGNPVQDENHIIIHEAQLDFLATQLLSRTDMSRYQSLFSQEEISRALWKASLLYWQHPSNHPFPVSILDSLPSSSNHQDSNSKLGLKKMSSAQEQIIQDFQKPVDALQKRYRLAGMGCLGGLGLFSSNVTLAADTMSQLFSQRVREWKECFQAMFQKWLNLIVMYKSTASNINVSKLYFYALCPGQTILFKGIMDSSTGQPVPVIVLSSTTEQSRHRLLSMGIKVQTWDETEKSLGVLSMETLLELESTMKRPMNRKESYDGPGMSGTRQQILENIKKRLAPMYIHGIKDCICYYEFFWNTLGGQLCTGRDSTGYTPKLYDVPLLLCRSLGPCIHTCLKSLHTWSKHSESSSDSKHVSLDIRGPIMPCAVQDIVGATMNSLIYHQTSCNLEPQKKNKEESDMNEVGSHYFVAHLRCHHGEEVNESAKALMKINRIGMSGLLLANDGLHDTRYGRGEYASTVVWDITRPASIMCKRDHYHNDM